MYRKFPLPMIATRLLVLIKMHFILLLCAAASAASAQTITTFAGTGVGTFGGDGGPAINARIRGPFAIAFDGAGNLYFADAQNHRIRRVGLNGIITTVAGFQPAGASNASGFSGDGGPATSAQLSTPYGVALDAAGNMYIVDTANHRIRRVTPAGIITTIAGSGVRGFFGDGGLATNAQLSLPFAVAVDGAGNVFIADNNNYRIRRVGTDGIITTVAGDGRIGSGPSGVPATSSSLSGPTDIKIDALGNLFIADFSSGVRRVDQNGIITTIAGGGIESPVDGSVATSVGLLGVNRIALGVGGNIYASTQQLNTVFRVDAQGIITRYVGGSGAGGLGDGGLARDATVRNPNGIAFSPRGDFYIADTTNDRIRKVTLNTTPPPAPLPPLSRRGGIDLDGQGRSAVVVNSLSGNQLQAGRLVNSALQWTSLPGPSTDFRVIAAVDFAGNGKSDLPTLRETPLNANGQGAVQYWPDFNGAAPLFLRDVKPAWDVQAAGDLDGDGLGDLVWRFRGTTPNFDDQGVSYIWFSGTAGTSINQVRKRGGAPLTWTLLGAADLNSDNAADMVYISPANAMRVLMATPNRTCANLSGGSIPAGFTALKLADFTGAGRADVLIRNATTGEVRLIGLNAVGLTLPPYAGAPDDPNASCTGSTLAVVQTNFNIATTDASWTLYATGDFNGDGTFDVIWKRPDNTLTLWLMTANGGAPTVINNAGTAPTNTAPLPLQ